MTDTATLDYPAAACSIALNLERFCDESLPYPDMIADAARKASARITALEAALEALLTHYVRLVDSGDERDEDPAWDDFDSLAARATTTEST